MLVRVLLNLEYFHRRSVRCRSVRMHGCWEVWLYHGTEMDLTGIFVMNLSP